MPGTDLLVALLVFLHFVVAGYDGLIHPAAFSILRVRFPDALLDFLLAVASKKRNSEPQSLGRCERCVPEHAGTGLSRTAKHWQVRWGASDHDGTRRRCKSLRIQAAASAGTMWLRSGDTRADSLYHG